MYSKELYKKEGITKQLALEETYKLGGVLASNMGYVNARTPNNVLPNQTFTIELPLEMISLENSYLAFSMTTTTAVGGVSAFNFDIRSVIQRLWVTFGSKTVYDTQNYNVFSNIANNALDVNYATSQRIALGTGNLLQRQTDFNDPIKEYAVELYHFKRDFFHNVYPLHKLGVQCIINIQLAPATDCIETIGPNGGSTYVMNNIKYYYRSIIPSENWTKRYDQRVVSPGVSYIYMGYDSIYDTSILSAGITSAQKILNFKWTSLIGIACVFRNLPNIGDEMVADKLSDFFNPMVISAQLRLGSMTFPLFNIRNNSEMMLEWMRLFGANTRGSVFGGQFYDTTSFIVGFPLSKHPKEITSDDTNNSIDGLNSSISSGMILDLKFGMPLVAGGYRLDVVALYESSLTFNPNGSITLDQ